jgi:DNA-binding NarL/FixJ family response regulator
MAARALNIAVVDDHLLVRRGVADLLSGWPHGQIVLEASDGVDYAKRSAEVGHIHIALVDLHMPRRNGFETIRWITKEQPRTRTIALCDGPSTADVQRLLRLDTRGVLCKNCTAAELHRAMQDVHVNHFHYNTHVSKALRREVQDEQQRKHPDTRWASLTPTEREVILLYTHAAVPNLTAVAERLGMKYHTAETHRRNAYKKLGIHCKPDMVRQLLLNGWQ